MKEAERIIYNLGNLAILLWFGVRYWQAGDAQFMRLWLISVVATFSWFILWMLGAAIFVCWKLLKERRQAA
jgi:hypothetical protein